MNSKKISSALISVFDKTGLEPLIKALVANDVTLYSTGGTESFIRELGHEVNAVEDLTGYPSILGGRVKTLHPKVFGGILNRSSLASDQTEIDQYEIPSFDLVIVDLYPFEKTLAGNASESEIIEKIDIGGIALIRAAAKNFNDVFCIILFFFTLTGTYCVELGLVGSSLVSQTCSDNSNCSNHWLAHSG